MLPTQLLRLDGEHDDDYDGDHDDDGDDDDMVSMIMIRSIITMMVMMLTI